MRLDMGNDNQVKSLLKNDTDKTKKVNFMKSVRNDSYDMEIIH